MVSAADNLLNLGIYTPAEAAFYARIRTQRMNSWLYGSKNANPVVSPERGEESRDVSFLDFVQALAIRSIRRDHRVSLQKIRGAVDFAKVHYKVSHPLAMQHATFLFDRKSKRGEFRDDDARYELVIKLRGDKGEELIQVTGAKAGNKMIAEIVELFLKDLTFDEEGRPEEYSAWRWGEHSVKMNPRKHFGDPLLPSGYTAQAIWESVKAEGSLEAAAKAYGVDRTEVELACSYLDFLQGASAT
jgi:hypothetical protein